MADQDSATPSAAQSTPSASQSRNKKGKQPNTSANAQPGSSKPPRQGARQPKPESSGTKPAPGTRLRGLPHDKPEVRISKTLSWILRHGAQSEGLKMRQDGYVKVDDLLANAKLKSQGLTLEHVKNIVRDDAKKRYDLILEDGNGVRVVLASSPVGGSPSVAGVSTPVSATSAVPTSDPVKGVWWIKANQGHSIKTVQVEMKAILSISDVPTGVAVHGTTLAAWKSIETQGLSKMTRNHIHFAQGIPGKGVISGMRNTSQVLIFVNLQKALDAGIKFFLSDNGVILTAGNAEGFLSSEFFGRVENAKREPILGWAGDERTAQTSAAATL